MNRVHTLSDQEIRALERLQRDTDDADVRSRCDMILWSNEGLSPPQIPKRVRFSRYAVVRYIRRYEAEGLAGLFTKPRPGRPRRVTAEYEANLLEAIQQEPRSLGIQDDFRTEKLVDILPYPEMVCQKSTQFLQLYN